MSFKVGDKVKVIANNNGSINEIGSIGIIKELDDNGTRVDVNGELIGNWHTFEEIELLEPKKTKNQRITALEKEVAELKIIVEELRGHKTIDFSPLVEEKPKSANQQRAEIIEKAKKFVDEHGEGFNFVSEHNCTLIWKPTPKGIFVEGAKCNPSDVFNEHIGKAIALGRALGLDVSEFEQAVQPTEIVPGMVAKGKVTGRIYNIKIARNKDHIVAKEHDGTVGNDHVSASSVTIINDTNAIY